MRWLPCILAAVLLSGCGLRGDLYLPSDRDPGREPSLTIRPRPGHGPQQPVPEGEAEASPDAAPESAPPPASDTVLPALGSETMPR